MNKKMLLVMGGLLIATHLKAQVVLEALDAPDTFTPSEKCLERVYDKHYGDGDHNFIYCAVMGPNGKKWLNLNLGAEYAREGSPHFNPEAIPTDYNDWKASGSLFQYGRRADGHELVTYSNDNQNWYANRVFPIINQPVDPINSPNNYVDTGVPYDAPYSYYWSNQHTSANISNDLPALSALWDGVNNPCPEGYRVMNKEDVLSFAKVGEFVLGPNSHAGLKTMGILRNTTAPNLTLFTGVIFEDNGGINYTCINGGCYFGSSGLWLSYASSAPFTFSSTGGWSGSKNHVNFLDFGYFSGNNSYELATGGIDYTWPLGIDEVIITRPFGAIRCVEK